MIEQHYTIGELAAKLAVSYETARKWVKEEHVVAAWGNDRSTVRKRRYVSRRVPESTALKILAKLKKHRF